MRGAEVEINTKVTFRTNYAEHEAFKDACDATGDNMARLHRDLERRYVSRHRRKKEK
jgi:hypothetical protein